MPSTRHVLLACLLGAAGAAAAGECLFVGSEPHPAQLAPIAVDRILATEGVEESLQRARPGATADGALPVGAWRVEFANGVIQQCDVRADGATRVTEPTRSSGGQASPCGPATLIVYADDRVERWSKVGQRHVVEHWFPGLAWPLSASVVGIADRIE